MSRLSPGMFMDAAEPAQRWALGLHGNVPGHQLDWIQRPELEGAGLRPHQLAQLMALIRDHDVPSPERATLTLGNLSRGLSKQGPGRDAMGLVCHFRVASRLDHGGRLNPRFVTAAVFTGPTLSPAALSAALEHLMGATGAREAGARRAADAWYARYVDVAQAGADVAPLVEELLHRLEIPSDEQAGGDEGWGPRDGATLPQRLVVTCEDELAREATEFMAHVAWMLSRSTLSWHSVTTSRALVQLDEGLVVQVLPDHERRSWSGQTFALRALGRDAESAARALLGLVPMRRERFVPLSAWSRERSEPSIPKLPVEPSVSITRPTPQRVALGPSPEELLSDARFAALIEEPEPPARREEAPRSRTWALGLIGFGVVLGLVVWGLTMAPSDATPADQGAVEVTASGDVGVPDDVEAPDDEEVPVDGVAPEEVPSSPSTQPPSDALPPPRRAPTDNGPTVAASPGGSPEDRPASPRPAFVDLEIAGERVELRSADGVRVLTGPSEVPPGEYSVWVRFAPDAEWVTYGELRLEPQARVSMRCAMWSCRLTR
ncbi:MAG: hypothetical protein H6740_15605 [Alphaproteobacteria bacterium]|nr:hypothetical protein [Alphaproteobacteria bacterium]